MQRLFDASQWFTYFPERMDTRRALWFVRDVLDVDAVRDNAAALAIGAGFQDFKTCEPFLSAFPSVFLALADGELVDTVADALAEFAPSVPVLKPAPGAFRDHANVREVLEAGGQRAVDHLMIGAIERPAAGLLDLALVERQENPPAVLSGVAELDRAIGGFAAGEFSVWTGKRGGGKSTLLGQLLLDAVDQGFPVCAYSGELPAWRFKQWTLLQAAGPEHVVERQDRFSGKVFYSVPAAVQKQIDDWWRGRFMLYDNRLANDEDSILRIFEYAVRRYGCCVFLLDNLMTTRFSSYSDRDFYRAQSSFTGRLVEFAKRNEVHVHLVAHPRKVEGGRALEADDIGGSGDVANRSDNAFSLTRLDEKEAESRGFKTVLRVLKNRQFGELISIGLDYEPTSRRFFKAGMGNPNKQYGWALSGPQQVMELPKGTPTPFEVRGA